MELVSDYFKQSCFASIDHRIALNPKVAQLHPCTQQVHHYIHLHGIKKNMKMLLYFYYEQFYVNGNTIWGLPCTVQHHFNTTLILKFSSAKPLSWIPSELVKLCLWIHYVYSGIWNIISLLLFNGSGSVDELQSQEVYTVCCNFGLASLILLMFKYSHVVIHCTGTVYQTCMWLKSAFYIYIYSTYYFLCERSVLKTKSNYQQKSIIYLISLPFCSSYETTLQIFNIIYIVCSLWHS